MNYPNQDIVVPGHVSRVLNMISEELDQPANQYVMTAKSFFYGQPARMTVGLTLKESNKSDVSKTTDHGAAPVDVYHAESLKADKQPSIDTVTDTTNPLANRSVYISMIEYDTVPGVNAEHVDNKTTVLVFEQRQPGVIPVTKTRHYVQPSFEGHAITAVTHRSMLDVGKDVVSFLITGIPPANV